MTIPGIDLGNIDLSNLMTYLYVLIGIAILAGILGGFIKGLKKTIYTTIIYIGVYVVAWIALPFVVDAVYELNIGDLLRPYVAQYFNMELFGQPITSIKNLVMGALENFVPGAEVILAPGSDALAFIEGAAIMVVRIIVFFVLLFVGGIVINLVGRILWTLLFKKIVGDTKYKDKDKTKKTNRFRLLGAAVGAVKGLFEALIIIVPIGGLMSVMSTLDSDTLRTLLGANPAEQTSLSDQEPESIGGIDAEAIITFIEEYKVSTLAQVVSQIKVGSEQKQIDYYIIDELGKIETKGNRKIYLREEIVVVLEVVSEFPEVFTGTPIDPFALEEEQINRIVTKLKESRLIPELIIIGVDYAMTMEEVQTVVEEYEIDTTALETIDWYLEFENILDIGGNVLKLGNPQELDYFNIEATKITNITTSISQSQIVNIMLPIAVNYALSMPEVEEMLGDIEYDFSEIVWGDEIVAIGDIYISITDLELNPDELDITLLDRLSDEVFFENVIDVIGAISTSDVITQLAPALADAAYNSFAPEDFQGVLSFSNLEADEWQDEFRRLLNIVVAITELGLLSGEPIDFTTLDMDAVRSVIENLFDLVVIQGNEGVLVTKLIGMIPPLVDGFEPNLDPSLDWKQQALQFVNIIEAVQELGITNFEEDFDPLTLMSAENADALANILIQLNHSLILREIIPSLINSYLGGGESSPINMGISLEDFLSEWLTAQTTIDPITQEKIPMASIAEWDNEIIYISRMLIIAMQVLNEDMSDLSNLAIGDKNYNAATVETFTTENAGFAQLLYLMNYSQSFKIEGIRTLLSTFLLGEGSLISTEKELGTVVPGVGQTIIEAWDAEIVAMMSVIEEAQDVIAALSDEEADIMDQLSDPSKVENILLAFNQSQVLRVVLPDFIHTLLSTTGMEEWSTDWLSDQVGVDLEGENNPTESITVWNVEISLLSKAISGINSAIGGGFGDGFDFTTINLGDVDNHPMLPDYTDLNPDFDTTDMGLAEVLFLVNHVKSLNIDGLRDILGDFLIGEGSLVATEKELGQIPGATPEAKTQNWDLEIITIIDLLSQYNTLFGSEETPDFLALLDDSSKIVDLLTPLNHSFILREILPDMIDTLLAGTGTGDLDGWFTDWLDDQVGVDGLGNNKPVESIATWDEEIEILAMLISVFNNAFDGALPTDISNLNVGDVNNHPILSGNLYDDSNPGLAELLYLMNYSNIFDVSNIRGLIGDFIVGPDKLINSTKELGVVTGNDDAELLLAWDDEIAALIAVIDQYNTVFANLDQGDYLDQLTDKTTIEDLLGNFNHSVILREVLPDLLYSVMPAEIVTDWVDTWLIDQVGVDISGDNNPVASIAEWDTEIEQIAGMIEAYNTSFSAGFSIDLETMNLGDVDNNPRILGDDYDNTSPGLAEILYFMNQSKSFKVDEIRNIIGDFLVGPGNIIETDKELGNISALTPEDLIIAWDDEIKALINVMEQYNTLFAGSSNFLQDLNDRSEIESLLGGFNHSIILREVLPDLLYSVMPTEIVTDWVDTWLVDQVGVDLLGDNNPVASIAEWDTEIEQIAGMIEAYNTSFSAGFSIDLETMNLGDVDNNPRLLGESYDNTAPGLAEILYFMNQSKSFKVDEIRNIIGDFLVGPGKIIVTDKELGMVTAGTPEDLVIAWDDEIKALINVMEQYNTLFAGSSNFLQDLNDRSEIESLLGGFNHSIILREVLPDLLYTVMPTEIVTDWVDTWLVDQVGVDGLGDNKAVASIAEWDTEIEQIAGMIEAYNISFSSGFSIDLETMNLGDVDNNPRLLGESYDNTAPGLAEILYFMNQSKSFKVDEIRNILADFLIGTGKLIETDKELGMITAGTPEDLVVAWDDEIYALISVMESYNSTFAGSSNFLEELTDRSVIETLLGRFNESIMLREVLPDLIYSVLPSEIIADWVDTWLVDQVGVDGLGDNKVVASYAEWQTEISNISGMIETYNKTFATGFSVDLATMPLGDVDNNPRLLGESYDNTAPGLAEMLYFMNQSKSFKVDEIRNILDEFLIGPGKLITTSKELGTITAGTPEDLVVAWDDEIYALISVMESYNSTFTGGDFLDNLTDRSEIETLLGKFNESIMLREVLPDMVYSVLPSEIIADWVDTWLVDQVGVDGFGDNNPVENYASWQSEISNIAGMIETYNKAFASGFNVDLATMPLGDVDNNPRILGNAYDNTSPGLAEMLYFMNQSKSFKVDEIRNILDDFLVGPGKLINTTKELGTVTAGTPEDLIIAWDEEIKDLITAIEKYNDITTGGMGAPLDLFSALDDESTISDVLGAFNASIMLREVLPDLINDIATSVGMTNWISTWLTDQVGIDGLGDNMPVQSELIWASEVVKIASVIAKANNAFGGDMSSLDISDSGLDADALGEVLHAMNDTDSFILDELNNIMKDGLNNLGYNVTNLNDKPSTKAEWTTEIDAIVSIITDMQIIGDVAVLDWNDMDSLMVDNNLAPVIRDIDSTTRQVTRGELLGLMLNTMGDSIILSPAMDQIIGSVFTSGGFDGYIDLTSVDLTELDWVDEIRAITSIKDDFDDFDGGADLRTLNATYIENMILNSSDGVIASQIMGTILMDQFEFILGANNPIDPLTSEPYDWRDQTLLEDNAHAIANMITLGEALGNMFGGNLDNYEDVGNAMKELQPGIGVDRPAFADIYLPAFVDYASGEDGMLDSVDMTTVDYVLEGNAFNQFFADWDRTDWMTSAATLPTAYSTLQSSGAQVSLVIVDHILGY